MWRVAGEGSASRIEGAIWARYPLNSLLSRARAYVRGSSREMAALGVFLALTLALTFPLIVQLRSHLAMCCDSWLYYWYVWWTKKAALGLRDSQFFTDYIYYPTGAQLYFENLYNSALGALLWPVFGGILSFNLLFLSTFVLGAFGVYLLTVRLTGDRRAGIVAGTVFVFSAVRSQNLQFTNMTTTQWVPFLALWTLKTIEAPTARNALVAAVFFFLVVMVSGYFAVSAAIFIVIIAAWHWRQTLTSRFARASAVFVAASAAMIVPVVFPVLRETLSGDSVLRNSFLTPYHSTDLASFVLPSRFNPLFDQFVAGIYPRLNTHFTEWESYLGMVAFALAAIGVVKLGIRRTGLWVAVLVVFATLSLGPYLQVMGKAFTSVPLYYAFIQELPVIESMRAPKRFLITGMLGLAVLAGFGSHYLLSRNYRWPGARYALTGLLVFLVITDYWGWPRSLVTTDATVPHFFSALAQDDSDAVILHIPVPSLINPQPLYFQTVHGRKLVGGYVERPLPESEQFIEGDSFLTSAHLPGIEQNGRVTPAQERDFERLLAQLPEIEYVVFTKRIFYYIDHHPQGQTQRQELRSFAVYGPWLESRFGPPIYEDELITVYRVRQTGFQ